MTTIDRFAAQTVNFNSPISGAFAITPADGGDLREATRSLWVGGAGDLKVTLTSGDIATYKGVPIGWFDIRAIRVWATGTTATQIIGNV